MSEAARPCAAPAAAQPSVAVTHAMRRARAAIVAETCFGIVSEAFGVPVADIRQVKGRRHAALRYAVYWLATGAGRTPVHALARYLGVERKAVMHGLAKLPLARAGDALLDAKLGALGDDVARTFPRGAP